MAVRKEKIENQEKKEKKTLDFSMVIGSFILIVGAIYLKSAGVLRTIMWFLALVLLLFNIVKTYKTRISSSIFIFALLFIVSIIVDGIVTILLHTIPVFAFNIISTGEVRVYNGVGVRVWQCNKDSYDDVVVDVFYHRGYMCDTDDIPVVDVNSFLNAVVENYDDYKNSYVKINGKISKKTGQNYLEMKTYETTDITINGYVSFADNITLKVIFDNPTSLLDSYDVYDEITLVGMVKNIEENNNTYVIYMHNGRVVSDKLLHQYDISVTVEQSCSIEDNIVYSSDTFDVYTHCLEEVVVSYPDQKYELANALSSGKLAIENLYDSPSEIKNSEIDNRKLYVFDSYSVLVCDSATSKDVILGNKEMNFDEVTCRVKEAEE